MFVRVKMIGRYEYLYLVKNAREGGRHVPRVIKALGRRDEGGWPAKNSRTFSRGSFLRNTTTPASSVPCAWKTFFAKSKPMVVAFRRDASFEWSSTQPLWHIDAVGGVHSIRTDQCAV